MRFIAFAVVATLVSVTAACGGDPSFGPDDPRNNTFDATIEGVAWTASTVSAEQSVAGIPGYLNFQGSSAGANPRTMAITLARIPGPGTYPLGMNTQSATGGSVTMVEGSRSWLTPLSGAAGTVTITSLTSSRVVGTFQFVAVPFLGTSGGPQTVTNGAFDVPLSAGFVAATPAQLGGKVSMDIAGFPIRWNAATTVASGTLPSLITVVANNGSYSATLVLGPIELGTLALSNTVPLRRLTVTQPGTAGGWGGTAGDQGSMTVTQASNGRLVGTFSATLAPTPATSTLTPLTITNGTFDVPVP